MKALCIFLVVLLLSACGSKLDGKYSEKAGLVEPTFKPNGTLSQSTMEIEMKYEIDGNRAKINFPQGVALVLTLLDDDSTQSPMGLVFWKQKK